MNLTIVMYHYVRPIESGRYPGIKGLELDLFKEQLDFLQSRFHFVSCEDIRHAVYRGKALPDRAMLLTFDDGYEDHYQHVFPQLKKRGIPGFFSMPGRILAERKLLDVNKVHFVLASASAADIVEYLRARFGELHDRALPSFDSLYAQLAVANRFDTAETIFVKRVLQNAIPEEVRNMLSDELFQKYVKLSESSFVNELYMTIDQVETMVADGMEFGIHGYDHKWLGELPDDEMESDLDRAVEVFRSVLPREWCMCFPYGSSSPRAVAQSRLLGATLGFSTEVACARIGQSDPMLLPRLDTNDFPPKSSRFEGYVK